MGMREGNWLMSRGIGGGKERNKELHRETLLNILLNLKTNNLFF